MTTSPDATPSHDSTLSVQDSGVTARIWQALREIEDPEIPVSLVDMGLVVAVDYDPSIRTAELKITYTAMGCPAMGMIQDDIRERLLRDLDVEAVRIEVVWDPVWTRKRLSEAARATMRQLGIAV
jgi:metal-sulfur cluster biosynthetic enzyme